MSNNYLSEKGELEMNARRIPNSVRILRRDTAAGLQYPVSSISAAV